MSPRLFLHNQYTVATLPGAVDNVERQYHAAEVIQVTKKGTSRKRAELAVCMDGEGVNLYDVGFSMILGSSSSSGY